MHETEYWSHGWCTIRDMYLCDKYWLGMAESKTNT